MISGHKYFIILTFLCSGVLGQNIGVYPLRDINFKQIITKEMLIQKNIKEKINCIPIPLEELASSQYIAKRYIVKDTIICTKDVELFKKEAVVFDFGTFEIEQQGKIIFENDEYVRIKKIDGTIEKIYKDGRLR